MVEGPGCKIKGENIKQKLKGKKIVNISAKHSACSTSEKCVERKQSQCNQLIHRHLAEVLTLGKELFLIFGDLCLRVHFLMNGSHRITSPETKAGDKKEPPVLTIDFSDSCLFFYQSSFDVRPAQPCLQRYEELKDIDICSPFFNHKRVVSLITEQKGRQLCDILLDQNILPGVGNIIKNEALFDSGINPCLLVDGLKREHVSHIVKMTRDFTMIFYKCRKSGSPLHKHYKIYAQETCKSCDTKVTKTKMGEDSGRVTYFCSKCQTSDTNKLDKRILPSRNSLLSWVNSSTSVNKTKSDWSCPACTLLNPANKIVCDICLGPKPDFSITSVKKVTDTDTVTYLTEPHKPLNMGTKISSSASKESPLHTTRNSSPVLKEIANLTESSSPSFTTLSNSRRSNSTSLTTSFNFKKLSSPALMVSAVASSHAEDKTSEPKTRPREAPGAKKRKSLDSVGEKNKKFKKNQENSDNGLESKSKFPQCFQHKLTCSLWQTHKPGPNKNRWFFTCSLQGNQKCNYFEWSDKRFPVCPGHGKTCGYHTVLKIGANNGRKFFSCSLPKKEQCQFFAWAEGFGDCGAHS